MNPVLLGTEQVIKGKLLNRQKDYHGYPLNLWFN